MMSIDDVLNDAALAVDVEASLEGALPILSEMAGIADARLALEGYLEQILLADGSVVDVLQAEHTYKDWRADNSDLAGGQASTGLALAAEIRSTLESLYSPSMESSLVQRLKRTYHGLSMTMKTFGKDLTDLRGQIVNRKAAIVASPVLLTRVSSYRFLTRKDKPVNNVMGAMKQDMAFIAACEAHYSRLDDLTVEMGRKFRDAARSDSDSVIRQAIDDFDAAIVDRSQYEDLTKFALMGNRRVRLDKRGFPRLRTGRVKALEGAGGTHFRASDLFDAIKEGAIQGFSLGGNLAKVERKGLSRLISRGFDYDDVEDLGVLIKSKGGVMELPAFLKVMEQTITLNNRVARFAQMAAKMGERIQRMEKDMFDAYDDVNTEKNINENDIRIRELRALHRSARRGIAQHMFMGKAIATVMEDHASYIYRSITTIANDVLKSTKE